MMSAPAASLPSEAVDPFAEKCVFWYLALTPLWWATGVLLPLTIVGIIFLFARRLPQAATNVIPCVFWIAVGAAQAVATAVNWSLVDEARVGLTRAVLSLVATGWVLLGLCIGAGEGLSTPRVVRAVCVQAAWIFVFGTVSLACSYALSLNSLEIPSPLALILPSSLPIVSQHLTMKFFIVEEFMGLSMVRLVLFYPWATALGVAGAFILLVGTRDPSRFWRSMAVAGGGMAVVFSLSRSVAVYLLFVALLAALARMSGPRQLVAIGVVAVALNAALLAGLDLPATFDAAEAAFTGMRAGSSEARQFVYHMTWKHVLESPVFGHGWNSGPVARWIETMPLGSHSTFYGVLYLGGVFTFIALLVAFVATAIAAMSRLRDRTGDAAVALAVLMLIGFVSYGENISNMVPSLATAFLWLGSALAPRRGVPALAPKTPAGFDSRPSIRQRSSVWG